MASILIFDSGVGGLSILQHIQAKLSHCHIDYLADHDAYPYGEKEENWLTKRCLSLIAAMQNKKQYDAIIIACNTASTLILPSLRANTDTPVIGVVPAIKTASQLSTNKKIGLLATPGTVSRQYMTDLISEFAANCDVTRVGSTHLVNLAEDKLQQKTIDQNVLSNIIEPFINGQCDHVVLGCTHFPLLLDELNALDTGITWVDSGTAIAKRAQHILDEQDTEATHQNTRLSFYSTSDISKNLTNELKQFGFTSFETLQHSS